MEKITHWRETLGEERSSSNIPSDSFLDWQAQDILLDDAMIENN